MKIQVLGPGCQRCETLHQNVIEACAELGVEAEIEKVMTPGLVVNGKVETTGHLLSVGQLTKILVSAIAKAE